MNTDKPNAACAVTTDFGLRRESRRAGATPLWEATGRAESGVAAALCHRSPNLCHPCAKLQDCIMDGANYLKVGRVTPCAPKFAFGRAAGSRRRAVAALWRAAKAEGLPALPVNPYFIRVHPRIAAWPPRGFTPCSSVVIFEFFVS